METLRNRPDLAPDHRNEFILPLPSGQGIFFAPFRLCPPCHSEQGFFLSLIHI